MDNTKQPTVNFWLSINKNGFINMSIDKPERNVELGKWVYKLPFVSICIYNDITNVVQHSKMTWESEPEFFSI